MSHKLQSVIESHSGVLALVLVLASSTLQAVLIFSINILQICNILAYLAESIPCVLLCATAILAVRIIKIRPDIYPYLYAPAIVVFTFILIIVDVQLVHFILLFGKDIAVSRLIAGIAMSAGVFYEGVLLAVYWLRRVGKGHRECR
jgi:hypothetical protein